MAANIQFGLVVRGQAGPDEDIARRFEECLAMVRLADRLGYDSLTKTAHYSAHPFQMLQLVPMLARFAAEAPRLRLNAGVLLLPLLSPLHVAEEFATLDVITSGKIILGVGLGYRDVEFDAFGIPRGGRLSRFLEALDVVQRLWTEEAVTFHGKHFQLQDVRLTMRPLQKPRPPIVVAASNDKMVERVARIGDAWTIAGHATLATLERQVALYRAALAAAGKPFPPPHFRLGKELYIARDMDTALREALPYIATKYDAYAQWGQDNVLPAGESFHVPIEELRQNRFIVGDPAYCIEQIERHRERLGIQEMGFRLHWPGMPHERVLRAIALLGERVLPHFA